MNNEELERLAILAEECSEVIQIIGKIIRHGYGSRNPNGEKYEINREMLEREIGDVQFIVNLMVKAADVSITRIHQHAFEKIDRIRPYLHFNQDLL